MKTLLGYNVNIDAVVGINDENIRSLICDNGLEVSPTGGLPGAIGTTGDFAQGLLYCLRTGNGGEVLITNEEVFDFLNRCYEDVAWYRMGGNAGNMANVLAELGADRVIPNVARLCPEQARQFSLKQVAVPHDDDLKHPLRAASEDEEPLIHFIFEFKEGTQVEVDGEVIRAPRENRFIATWDIPNTRMEINPQFKDYTARLRDVDGAIVSGFHVLQDDGYYKDKVGEIREQLATWRRNNPDIKIHLELGHFQNDNVKLYVMNTLSQEVDSIGMNEEELGHYLDLRGHSSLARRVKKGVLEAMTTALAWCAEDLGTRRLCVHTKDYVLSALKDYVSPEKEVRALRFGTDNAAALAATASIDPALARRAEEFFEVNQIGLEERRNLIYEGFTGEGRGAYGRVSGYWVCMAPSLRVKIPKRIVGLGDAFTAGSFYQELL